MKKLLSLIFLTLFLSNTAFSDDIIYEYSEKLENKELSTNQIIEICKEYESKNIDIGQYDQATFNTGRGLENYCATMKMRVEFKSEAKVDLIQDGVVPLNIEKLDFKFINNKNFILTVPDNKNSSCKIDIKNEKRVTLFDISRRCGVDKIITQEVSPSCASSECDLISLTYEDEDDLKNNWINIIDYFYADVNNDGYMDLAIRFQKDGGYSMGAETMTVVITSRSKDNFININYKEAVNSFNIGNDVYLNACGGNPDKYYDKPLNIKDVLIEVPNKIIKLEKSKYDREFQTLAKSKINLENKTINISVSNFRDLIIKNDNGDILATRKITGASSIYEIKHKGAVVAWGVGWHKQCGELYSVDFTALRLFIPIEKNDEIEIVQKLVSLNLTDTYKTLLNSKKTLLNSENLVLSNAIDLSGSSSASTYYYKGSLFFEINRKEGFKYIIDFNELSEKINIDNLNPVQKINILSQFNEIELLEKFTKENFHLIYNDLKNNFWTSIYLDFDKPDEERYRKIIDHPTFPPLEIFEMEGSCQKVDGYTTVRELTKNCYYWHSSMLVWSSLWHYYISEF